ncbi:MAG TPA: leucyl/phenylalanyl-tRNA--protein transferase [Methylibium sp.]
MIRWLDNPDTPFPDTRMALPAGSQAPGLLAAGGELSPERLAGAYEHGIFPWYGQGQPVLWWSPDPRMVLPVREFRLSRSLRKALQRFIATPGCELAIDRDFERVMRCCAHAARPGQDGTWILPEMVRAYAAWHRLGDRRSSVHSFETWIDGELVGGLYGVSIGRMFFGESMFSLRTDASKIALAALVAFALARGIPIIDCQQNTAHLASLGAREMARVDFEQQLASAVQAPPIADWTYDPQLWAGLDARLKPYQAPPPGKAVHQ